MTNPGNLERFPNLDRLRELARERDASAQDHEVRIKREHLHVDQNPTREGSQVWIGQTAIGSDGGWTGLARMLSSPQEGVPMPVNVLRSLDPDTMSKLLDSRIPPGGTDKQVRLWESSPGERIVRAIVSPGYHAIPAQKQVDQLLSRMHDAEISNYRIAHWASDPDSWAAEVIDSTRGIGSNGESDFAHLMSRPAGIFQDPQDSPSYVGFKLRADDTGKGSASIASYLWRLICSNGMVCNVAESRVRAIHRGSGEWNGNLLTGQGWMDLLEQARAESLSADADTVDVFNRLRQLAQRPSVKAVRMSLDEALGLSNPGEGISRWALSQGAAAAANKAETATLRDELQRWSGRIMSQPISEVLPTLESLKAA